MNDLIKPEIVLLDDGS